MPRSTIRPLRATFAATAYRPISMNLSGHGRHQLALERDRRESEGDPGLPVRLDVGPPSDAARPPARALSRRRRIREPRPMRPRALANVRAPTWPAGSRLPSSERLADSGYKLVTGASGCGASIEHLGPGANFARSRGPRPVRRRAWCGLVVVRASSRASATAGSSSVPPARRSSSAAPSRRAPRNRVVPAGGDDGEPVAADLRRFPGTRGCARIRAPPRVGSTPRPVVSRALLPGRELQSARAMPSWSSLARESSSERPPISRRSPYLRVCRAASARMNRAIASRRELPSFRARLTASSQCARARS